VAGADTGNRTGNILEQKGKIKHRRKRENQEENKWEGRGGRN